MTLFNRNKASDQKQPETVNREQMKEQYKKTLEQLNTLWNRIEQTQEESQDQMLMLSSELKQADTKCKELNDAFKNFKRAIAREAKHSRNGKKIPFKVRSCIVVVVWLCGLVFWLTCDDGWVHPSIGNSA